jgi:hypothetical protein
MRCTKCGKEKPETDFYRERRAKRGYRSECKARTLACSAAWRTTHPDRKAKSDRRYRQQNPERVARAIKAWVERNPERRAAHTRHHDEKNPPKARARSAVRTAVRRGKLVKPSDCERCGTPTERHDLHGHHDDYSKPLEVEWLCAPCHAAVHTEAKQVPA